MRVWHYLLWQVSSVMLFAMASNNIKTLEQYGTLRRNLSLKISQRIKDLPFGPRQMVMLKVIYTQGEISLGKLAERVGTDPGTVSRSIAQMVDQHWVEKTQSPDDGRLWKVKMSAEGTKQMPAIMDIYSELADMMVASLTPEEHDQFLNMLIKINAHFDKLHGK
jgi:MarR family transcriptional regulator, transcriptional regulator for hemolysin